MTSASLEPPPYSNRGVRIVEDIDKAGFSDFEFDAYCASVDAERLHVLDYLEQALLEAGFETVRDVGPKVPFYDRNDLILDDGGHRLLSVRSGGRNGTPFVECKGSASPVVAAELRESFPAHFPSRIDSALDLRGPEVFNEFQKLAKAFERSGVKLNQVGAQVENEDRGTTLYLGSRSSQFYVRIYQKGLKHAEECGLVGDAIPDDLRHWVRIELECKPLKRSAKTKASSMSAVDLWGGSPWVRRLCKEAFLIDAERVTMREKRESNLQRSFRFSAEQYGPTHREMIERIGLDAYLELWLASIGHTEGRQSAA